MLQGVEAGRKTEVEIFSGKICGAGLKHEQKEQQAMRRNAMIRQPRKARSGGFRNLILVASLAAAALVSGCEGSPDQVSLEMPELSSVADGMYRATASVPPVIARVEVSVSSGRITGFRIRRHLNGQGRAAEVLADRVVERQTIQLDSVTGATYSSRAILKAGRSTEQSCGFG